MVELSAGDALLVPRGWWHYVQNVDPLNITLNIWVPHVSIFSFLFLRPIIRVQTRSSTLKRWYIPLWFCELRVKYIECLMIDYYIVPD